MGEVNNSVTQAQVQALVDQAVAGVSGAGVTQAQVNSTVSAAVGALVIPVAASAMPPGVSDSGSIGNTPQVFAHSDHTHASRARKAIKVMPSAATTYTWTFPTAFAAGVVPVCNCIAQVPAGTTDLFNVQVIGAPTNTQATFQINRVSAGLLSLLTGALSINPTPIAATLHLIALEP